MLNGRKTPNILSNLINFQSLSNQNTLDYENNTISNTQTMYLLSACNGN
jgi:hypothetical protein